MIFNDRYNQIIESNSSSSGEPSRVVTDIGNVFYYKYPGSRTLHNPNGPAIIYHSDEGGVGDREWFIDGDRHRIDGPAVVRENGDREWWVNDKRHRLDGPAVIKYKTEKQWWVDDHLHRTDGPAIVTARGYTEWWIKGTQLWQSEIDVMTAKSRDDVSNVLGKYL